MSKRKDNLLYFIIGPVTQKDINTIEDTTNKYSNIYVVLQGGIDSGDGDWSTTIAGALPANAAMNPGEIFHNKDGKNKGTNRGWYDLLNSEFLNKHPKVNVTCQITNSAKPGNVKQGEKDRDSRRILWKKLHEDDFFKDKPMIKNIIKMYDACTGAPWQHDPIAVIHTIIKFFPDFFKEEKCNNLKQFISVRKIPFISFDTESDGEIYESDGTSGESISLGGAFMRKIFKTKTNKNNELTGTNKMKMTNLTAKSSPKNNPIEVIPYKETFKEMEETCQERKNLLFDLLSDDNPKSVLNPKSITSIKCSLEIYDSDNLLALKCIQSFSKKMSLPLEVIVHSQVYPMNVNFINNLPTIFNYRENIDIERLERSITSVRSWNTKLDLELKDENTNVPTKLKVMLRNLISNYFCGSIFAPLKFKEDPTLLDFFERKPALIKYIQGFLMYSQLRHELENQDHNLMETEMSFIRKFLGTSSKVQVVKGDVYGKEGFSITASNLLHPISMISYQELSDGNANIEKIIERCINTNALTLFRQEKIKSWNNNYKIQKNDPTTESNSKPEKIFHWNVLDPGTCTRFTVGPYFDKENDLDKDPYFIKKNDQRMVSIASMIREKLEQGFIVHLQEYSHKQHEKLKEEMLTLTAMDGTKIDEDNIDDYMNYSYGSKTIIPTTSESLVVDQGLLIASLWKIDKRDLLFIGGDQSSKPVLCSTIGNTMFMTTHYPGVEGTSQSNFHKQVNTEIEKLKVNYPSINFVFSCDMNKNVTDEPIAKTEELTPFKGSNIIFKHIQSTESTPAYQFDSLELIQQSHPDKLTSKPLVLIPDRNLMNNESYKDAINKNLTNNIYTIPGKKIDGIFCSKGMKITQTVKVIDPEGFLSDHNCLILDLTPLSRRFHKNDFYVKPETPVRSPSSGPVSTPVKSPVSSPVISPGRPSMSLNRPKSPRPKTPRPKTPRPKTPGKLDNVPLGTRINGGYSKKTTRKINKISLKSRKKYSI
jgi:hypothetical protein